MSPFWLTMVGGLLALAWLARGLVLPIFLAMAFAYLLSPIIVWTDARAIRRSVAVGVLFLVLVSVLAGVGLLLGPRVIGEVSAVAARLPGLMSEVDERLDGAVRELTEAVPALRKVLPAGGGWVHRFLPERPARDPSELFEHMGHLFIVTILVPFFAFFLLRDLPRILNAAMDRLPPQHVETSVAVWRELNGVIGRYIRGVVMDGIVVGVLAALGLWALRVPYPLLLGVFAGVANVVPFVGPLLSAAAAGLVVLLTPGQGTGALVRVLVLFLLIKVLDDTLIQPFTIGRSVHLHPALLLGSVVVGNHAMGVLGMIIAVPVATVLQETVRLLLEHRRVLARRRGGVAVRRVAGGAVLLALALPATAVAQAAAMPTIGVIVTDPTLRQSFVDGLRQVGYVDGQSIRVESRSVPPGPDVERRARAGIEELNRLGAVVIVPSGAPSVKAAKELARAPVVAIDLESDPVAAGFVQSLARPGGNLTGFFLDLPELGGKQLQLLQEALGRVTRVGILWDDGVGRRQFDATSAAARATNVAVTSLPVRSADELGRMFEGAAKAEVRAIVILTAPVIFQNRERIAELAIRHRFPTISVFTRMADAGGLIGYGPDFSLIWRRAASYVDRILKGAKPADLPVERPTKFEMVVNMKTARALGLSLPPSLGVRADRVIE